MRFFEKIAKKLTEISYCDCKSLNKISVSIKYDNNINIRDIFQNQIEILKTLKVENSNRSDICILIDQLLIEYSSFCFYISKN